MSGHHRNDKKKRQNDGCQDNKERLKLKNKNVDDGHDDEELRLPTQQSLDVMFGGDFMLSEALPYLDTVSIVDKKIVCRQWKETCDAAIDNKGRQKEKKPFVEKAELRAAVERYNGGARDDIENIAGERGYPIGKWDVSRVNDFSEVFANMRSFNEDIGAWDVGNATDMGHMFYRADSFNQSLAGWDVSNVKNMGYMFYCARAFDGDISAWDTSSITDMCSMFQRACVFNGDLSAWDTSGATDMRGMFREANKFNGDVSAWDTSGVSDAAGMFCYAAAFDGDISGWNVSRVIDMRDMFSPEDEAKFDRDRLNSIKRNWERQGKRWW